MNDKPAISRSEVDTDEVLFSVFRRPSNKDTHADELLGQPPVVQVILNEQSNAMEGARECVRQIIRGWSDNPPKIEWLTSFDDRDTRFPVLHLSGLQGRILNMEPVFLLNTKTKRMS